MTIGSVFLVKVLEMFFVWSKCVNVRMLIMEIVLITYFNVWITYLIELICMLSIILCLYRCESVAMHVSK